MELLVYVRNHGGRSSGNTVVGACVGEAPSVESIETRASLTSSAEFRVDAAVEDPIGELADAVEQVFVMTRDSERHGRAVYLTRARSAVRILMEPGFDQPGEIARDLAEMLAMCSPRVAERSRLGTPSLGALHNAAVGEADAHTSV